MDLAYLEKFKNLPLSVRQELEKPEVLQAVQEIGRRYQVDLAGLVIKAAVGEIDYQRLAVYFADQYKFDKIKAQSLDNELRQKVFSKVANYLYQFKRIVSAPAPSVDDYIKQKLEAVVGRAKLALGSAELETRLRSIILTYLKGVRDKFDTREALVKPQTLGGLGLDEESASNLLLLADGQIKDSEQVVVRPVLGIQRFAVPEDVTTRNTQHLTRNIVTQRDVDYDLKQFPKAPMKGEVPASAKQLAPLVPNKIDEALKPIASAIIDKKEIGTPKGVPISKPQPRLVPQPKPISNIQRDTSGRPRLDDIKTTPKIFSPVDELRFMTLRNWRNLGSDPQTVAVKIKQKLKALEDEDYGKMVAGIKAFKQSPLNRMYLSVFYTGLAQCKDAAAVLQAMRAADSNFLTESEFEAIIKLNQDLKF